MSDKAKKRRKQRRNESEASQRPSRPLAPESRQAEVTTVVWTLSILATLGAEFLLLIAGTVLFFAKLPAEQPATMIPGVLMFIACVSGLLCLILTPLVYRLRVVAPPRLITAVAVVAGVLPLIAAIASLLSRAA